jgi:hypothetical protein
MHDLNEKKARDSIKTKHVQEVAHAAMAAREKEDAEWDAAGGMGLYTLVHFSPP